MSKWPWVACVVFSGCLCGPSASGDGGTADSGRNDAGLERPEDAGIDAGINDAGPVDAGDGDAGFDDAGFDAGLVDAGHDAGLVDGGADAGLVDAGDDGGLADAGDDAGRADAGYDAGLIDAGGIDAGCDPTAIRWTTLPPHAGFDGLIPWMHVWRTDGGVMLTHRGSYILLDDALTETSVGLFSPDGGYGGPFSIERRRDGFDVLTNDFPGSSTWLHHLSETGAEDRPVLRFDNPVGAGPGVFAVRQTSGTSTIIAFTQSPPAFADYLFRWDEGTSTLVQLHSPPGMWGITLAGDAQLIMNYSAGSQPVFTEILGDGGTRFLSLVGWPPAELEGQFVLPTFYFFSPGGPVQRRDGLADSGLTLMADWSGSFEAPLRLATTESLGSTSPPRWVIKWNEGTYFSLDAGVHSIDRFDERTLVVSRVNQDGTIDVGLLCDP